MGYEHRSATVVACVSRHNSARDDEHDALWEELHARVTALVKDPRFEPITAMLV